MEFSSGSALTGGESWRTLVAPRNFRWI